MVKVWTEYGTHDSASAASARRKYMLDLDFFSAWSVIVEDLQGRELIAAGNLGAYV